MLELLNSKPVLLGPCKRKAETDFPGLFVKRRGESMGVVYLGRDSSKLGLNNNVRQLYQNKIFVLLVLLLSLFWEI